MNKIIYFILGCLLLGLIGCEQKIDSWSGQDVAYLDSKTDSTLIPFIYINSDLDTVKVRVQVMGNIPVSEDRYVSVKIRDIQATAGVDYEPLKETWLIPAGGVFCEIPVVLKRPSDKAEKRIVVELMENEYFKLLYQEDVLTSGSAFKFSTITHQIIYHNLMKDPPVTWNEYYFGKFSATKFEKICTFMQIDREQFLSYSYMTFGRIKFIALTMKEELEKNPVPDEDGDDMRMGDDLYGN